MMKLLLTSAGIHNALLDLLGKPIAEASAHCIPTASYGPPWATRYGLAIHQRKRTAMPHDRIGVEVRGHFGTDRAAQH